jgi:hypothetical protein
MVSQFTGSAPLRHAFPRESPWIFWRKIAFRAVTRVTRDTRSPGRIRPEPPPMSHRQFAKLLNRAELSAPALRRENFRLVDLGCFREQVFCLGK